MHAIGYWPWWIAAAALGALTVGAWLLTRRPLGVSGIMGRFVNLREELAVQRSERAFARDGAAAEAALLAMTREAFGDLPSPSEVPLGAAPAPPAGRALAPRPSLGAHATFLVALALGGLLSRLLHGSRAPSADLGPAFASLVGQGWRGWAALLAGGAMVGFGTTLAGGCSSGHGLFGCARLQPGSLVATALFFGAAVGVSFLLAGGLS